jgi:hypothetical protein
MILHHPANVGVAWCSEEQDSDQLKREFPPRLVDPPPRINGDRDHGEIFPALISTDLRRFRALLYPPHTQFKTRHVLPWR